MKCAERRKIRRENLGENRFEPVREPVREPQQRQQPDQHISGEDVRTLFEGRGRCLSFSNKYSLHLRSQVVVGNPLPARALSARQENLGLFDVRTHDKTGQKPINGGCSAP